MKAVTRSMVIGSILASLVVTQAHAAGHNKLDPNIKYRQDVMEAMSHHFAALAAIFTGRVERPGALKVHADALAATAALTGSLFPEGSEGGDALPRVWEEPDGIQFGANKIKESTANLAAAIAEGDRGTIAKAFKEAGDGCKGCHERYKAEDE